jgi:hypothetical protein
MITAVDKLIISKNCRHLWSGEQELSQDRRRTGGPAQPVPLAGGPVRQLLVLFGLAPLRGIRLDSRSLRRWSHKV